MATKTFRAVVGAVGLLAMGATVAMAEPTVEVAQGSVARWSGEDCTQCAMNGRAWDPVDGVCYYPVDMARRPDHYQIARSCSGTYETGWLIVTEKECLQEDIDFPDDSYVNLSNEDLNRHHGEQAVVKPLFRGREGEAKFSLPLAKPAEPLPDSDNFGACRTFNGEPKNRHTGADYAISGTAKAMAPGRVVLVGDHFFSGKSVYIDHGNGLVSMIFHLNDFAVEQGQEVEAGTVLGEIGSTGRSTGIHLHVGLRWHGERVDPDLLFADPAQLPTVSD